MEKKKPAKSKKNDRKRYIIPNLKKAFELLEMLSESPDGITFPQMLEKMACNKTSLFRILMTIEDMGYIRKNPETDAYSVSRKILSLAYSALCDSNLIGESMDILRKVRDITAETTMLGVLLDDECVMIEQEYGLHPFNFTGKLGMKSPLHASAPGKALLAALPDDERAAVISRIKLTKNAANTITTVPGLEKELERIAANGYSSDESEAVDGVNCVAAAIRNSHGYPVAVLWITGPSNRILAGEFDILGRQLCDSAKAISERLGYTE